MKKKVIIGSMVATVGLAGILAGAVVVHGQGAAKANAAAYEALLNTIYGTATSRHRGEKLLHHRIQDVIKNCMSDKGIGYVPPAYTGSSAGVVAPGDLDVATPLSNSFGIAERLRAHAQGVEAEQKSSNRQSTEAVSNQEVDAAYSAAMDGCISKAMPLEEEYHPAGQQEVVGRLLAELRKLQTSEAAKPLIASYQDCIHKAGYKTNSRLELHEDILKRFPNPEQPWSRIGTSQQWQEAINAEQEAATADKTCRSALYKWATEQMRPAVDRLSSDPQVEAVRRGWERIEADYKAAGLHD